MKNIVSKTRHIVLARYREEAGSLLLHVCGWSLQGSPLGYAFISELLVTWYYMQSKILNMKL